jgi:hypothetical protein
MSYALGDRVSLVAFGTYAFDIGGTKLPFAPRLQALSVIPRAIFDLSRSGAYAEVGLIGTSVTGQQRYQAYKADGALGIVYHRFNIALRIADPIAYYTRERVFFHDVGFRTSWRP